MKRLRKIDVQDPEGDPHDDRVDDVGEDPGRDVGIGHARRARDGLGRGDGVHPARHGAAQPELRPEPRQAVAARLPRLQAAARPRRAAAAAAPPVRAPRPAAGSRSIRSIPSFLPLVGGRRSARRPPWRPRTGRRPGWARAIAMRAPRDQPLVRSAAPVAAPGRPRLRPCPAPSSSSAPASSRPPWRRSTAHLLAATGRTRPRVAIVPTASWPDGEETFQGWVEQGRAHFAGARRRGRGRRAADARGRARRAPAPRRSARPTSSISPAGSPTTCSTCCEGTPAGAALRSVHDRDGIIVGCSAGAMVLAARQPRVRGRRFVRFPTGWRDALGFVEGAAVLPHYDAFPEPLAAAVVLAAPRRHASSSASTRRPRRSGATAPGRSTGAGG